MVATFYFLFVVCHVVVVICRMTGEVSARFFEKFSFFVSKILLSSNSDSPVSDLECKHCTDSHALPLCTPSISRVWLKIESQTHWEANRVPLGKFHCFVILAHHVSFALVMI